MYIMDNKRDINHFNAVAEFGSPNGRLFTIYSKFHALIPEFLDQSQACLYSFWSTFFIESESGTEKQ